MSFNHTNITKQIFEMTKSSLDHSYRNIFKETLIKLKEIFSEIYYTDGEGNLVKVQCVTGKQERAIGKLLQESNLVLPVISIVESGINNSDNARTKISNILVQETVWDPKSMRATRVLSLPPRPVNISYNINVWCKYAEDMDMIRSSIISKFNPHIPVNTKFSDFSLGYLSDESELSDAFAQDVKDRTLKKTIKITVESYIPSPKFLYTSTGQIELLTFDIDIG